MILSLMWFYQLLLFWILCFTSSTQRDPTLFRFYRSSCFHLMAPTSTIYNTLGITKLRLILLNYFQRCLIRLNRCWIKLFDTIRLINRMIELNFLIRNIYRRVIFRWIIKRLNLEQLLRTTFWNKLFIISWVNSINKVKFLRRRRCLLRWRRAYRNFWMMKIEIRPYL